MTPNDVADALSRHGYLPDEGISTAVFLSMTLRRPLLLEGEAGVGKTELAKTLAAATGGQLIFKGGTALAKILADFYRLSEDLDFVIPLPVDATRRRRSDRASRAKAAVTSIGEALPAAVLLDALLKCEALALAVGSTGAGRLVIQHPAHIHKVKLVSLPFLEGDATPFFHKLCGGHAGGLAGHGLILFNKAAS